MSFSHSHIKPTGVSWTRDASVSKQEKLIKEIKINLIPTVFLLVARSSHFNYCFGFIVFKMLETSLQKKVCNKAIFWQCTLKEFQKMLKFFFAKQTTHTRVIFKRFVNARNFSSEKTGAILCKNTRPNPNRCSVSIYWKINSCLCCLISWNLPQSFFPLTLFHDKEWGK